jgi:hypothetical protein
MSGLESLNPRSDFKNYVYPLTLQALFFVSGCESCSDDKSITSSPNLSSNTDPAKLHGFPPYPDLVHLCSQRVYGIYQGNPVVISWDAFSSASPPAMIVEHYLMNLGNKGFARKGNEAFWQLAAGSEPYSMVLDIYPVRKFGPHKQCEKMPPSGSKTIVVLIRDGL